jgi:hypothetical protein
MQKSRTKGTGRLGSEPRAARLSETVGSPRFRSGLNAAAGQKPSVEFTALRRKRSDYPNPWARDSPSHQGSGHQVGITRKSR